METVKGFKDFTGEEAEKRQAIRKLLVETFEKYGFEPAETPIIEQEEFVKGENQSDEAVSDIFKLQDKGKRKLALRYELTFPLKRIAKGKKLPYKRYQIGEVFRDEPVQGNRLRQFTSADADIIGLSNISAREQAEVLATAKEILDKLIIKNYKIYINNRKLINEILNEIKVKSKKEVIKELDKLDKLSEDEVRKNLKKYNAEKVLSIIQNKQKCKKYKTYKEIEELKKYCNYYGVKVEFLPTLARGLSYYDGTIFEIKSDIKETIIGGGAYTFNNIPSFGYGTSIERLSIVSKIKSDNQKILVISINQDKEAIKLAQKLRSKGKSVLIMYGKPSKALDYANSVGIAKVIFIGKEEVKKKKFKVKDMKTGKEKFVNEKEL
ncbi:ATP phosphoribosyltransferase regulatory subunit [Candidatus Pacearchaeota archaeon]|nr:ATP phosphoribosyltransferase regulatory subunit [Candidatus Pacearchaeota archaeon]